MIGNGVLMGIAPSEVRALSVQDFSAIAKFWAEAHGGKKAAEQMSDDDLAALGIEGA